MISTAQIAWLAGFLEGEGSFAHPGPRAGVLISAAQVQHWPLDKVHTLVGGHIASVKRQRANWSDIYVWQISGYRAAGIMMTIYCLMSPKRQGQIRKILVPWLKAEIFTGLREHCPRGHIYDQTYTSQGYRRCSECHRTHYHKRDKWMRKIRVGAEIF